MKKILLVSFAPSHVKHNNRIAKLLGGLFQTEHFNLSEPGTNVIRRAAFRETLRNWAQFFSIPFITITLLFYWSRPINLKRRKTHEILSEMIDNYFSGEKSVASYVLNLNRTLREQRYKIQMSDIVLTKANELDLLCVLLPEDNNYYSSGLIINGLHSLNIKVGVVDFTIGKEEEFAQSGKFLASEGKSFIYALFARIFLSPPVELRWKQTRPYINCFPGSLETRSHDFLTPGFESGLADFYLNSDDNELAYIRDKVQKNAIVAKIDPIELSLAQLNNNVTAIRNGFGVFLPPDQMTDDLVRDRMQTTATQDYEKLISTVLTDSREICGIDEEMMVFPHPRIYVSHPSLIAEISKNYRVLDDFSYYLLRLNRAVIFSSAVFSALLAANVKVFNLDIYEYQYDSVFPKDSVNFINIKSIQDIPSYLNENSNDIYLPSSRDNSLVEFLKSNLELK